MPIPDKIPKTLSLCLFTKQIQKVPKRRKKNCSFLYLRARFSLFFFSLFGLLNVDFLMSNATLLMVQRTKKKTFSLKKSFFKTPTHSFFSPYYVCIFFVFLYMKRRAAKYFLLWIFCFEQVTSKRK